MTGSTSQLTELQLDILRVLWSEGELPVAAVHAALAPNRELAPTTVATLLKRLEKRGVVTHRSEGRQYLFRPLVSEEEATRSILDDTVDKLFAGDVPAMMAQLLRSHDVGAGDLERIRGLLDERSREMDAK
ncbi:MAG: BlaI/MecI/CopY family transcriptional regulator [Planctomycetota bacterium]|nr:BlaI/MecI/CopY family transcriptional regulator [Planctomycetota bacterium]